jgi:hypothetical protein
MLYQLGRMRIVMQSGMDIGYMDMKEGVSSLL